MTEQESINLQTSYSQIDAVYSSIGAVSADEIAQSRFGGSSFGKSIIIDWEKRKQLEEQNNAEPVFNLGKPDEPETLAEEAAIQEEQTED